MISLVWTVALLLQASLVAAPQVMESGLPVSFDNAAGQKPIVAPPPPARLPAVSVVPDDLDSARAVWGIDAQIALLAQKTPDASFFRFGVIGDAEEGRFAWERIFSPGPGVFAKQMASLQALDPAFVLQLGDFVSKGTVDNYRDHVSLLGKTVKVPFFPVIGNHDRSRPNGDADKSLYEGLMGKTDFYFDFGGWRFVGLDTSDRRLRSSQVEWLKTVLPDNGRSVVFTHVPPAFIKGKIHSPERLTTKEFQENRGYIEDVLTAYFEENSGAFKKLLKERRVARVYMGHIHAFGVARVGPTLLVLSGGGGSPLYPLPPNEPQARMAHFIEAQVSGDTLTETVHELGGRSYPLPLPPP